MSQPNSALRIAQRTAVWGVCLAYVGLAIRPVSAADQVFRRGGAKVTGTISATSREDISIKPVSGEVIKIPGCEVSSVEWDDAKGAIKLAINDDVAGRLDKAYEGYRKAREDQSGASDLFRREVDYLNALCAGKIALQNADRQGEAIRLLEGVLTSQPDHFRYYDAALQLSRIFLVKKDFGAARKALAKLSEASAKEVQTLGAVELALVDLRDSKLDAADQAFDRILAETTAESSGGQPFRYRSLLGKAQILVLKNRALEGISLVEDVTENGPPGDSSLMAEAYLVKGHCLQSAGRTKEALLSYLHVDLLFARESAAHAESLYHLARLWRQVKSDERGLEAEGRLNSLYPNSEWSKKR